MKTLLASLAVGLGVSASKLADANTLPNDTIPVLPVDRRCHISVGEQVIDYGAKSRGQLLVLPTARHRLSFGRRTVMLNVVCPYPQPLRLMLHGERIMTGDWRFGEYGSISVRLLEAQVDGNRVQVVSSSAEGLINATPTHSTRLRPGYIVSASLNNQLILGKVFTARLEIEPSLPEVDTGMREPQTSEGRLILELMQ